MNGDYSSSFLSKEVRKMLIEIGETQIKNYTSSSVFVKPCMTLNWKKIETVLCVSDDFSIHNQKTAWFIDKICQFWPIFIEAHSLLHHSIANLDIIQDLCEWTSHAKKINEYFNLFLNDDVSTTEAVLFLTAVLERSLGNLFLLEGKSVPFLLRDLLSTPEMEIVLGKVPVVFLQILIGTPLALNLRNIAWHGFPRADELYPHFVSILFVIILSIGELLKQKMVDFIQLPKRSQIQYSDNVFSDKFPIIQKYHNEILKLLSQSNFIPVSHYFHWKKALEHYQFERYGRSLLLLLPQVEHMLRCLFCHVNNCSERVLTAESDSLYLTLNEIMSESVVNEEGVEKKNALISFLGESVIEMLQDVFVHQAGPRIRDKMSHGECDIDNIPETLVNHLIYVALTIEIKSNNLQNDVTKENKPACELTNQITSFYKRYKSEFHPTALLKIGICDCLSSLKNVSFLYGKMEVHEELRIIMRNNDKTELASLIKQLYSFSTFNSFLCNDNVYTYIVALEIKTVFRHKSENELVNLLRKITENVKQINEQVMHNLEEKCSFYSQHLLRSRQRDTFQRMVQIVPKLKDVLFCGICIAVKCLKLTNKVCNIPRKEFENLMKFCRTILQFVQNVSSLTRQDKNRWLEIEILTTTFCQKVLVSVNAFSILRDMLVKEEEKMKELLSV